MMNKPRHLLILPHLQVQNANAISSPLTWGFPAMGAFVGFMHALERALPDPDYLELRQVGVVCHSHEIQSSPAGYNLRQFHLTRNPVGKDGTTAAIAEEGRMHLDVSLIFAVTGDNCRLDDDARANLARNIFERACGMRIAGGSILNAGIADGRNKPMLVSLPDEANAYDAAFRGVRRRLLPGFALVLNEQALADRQADLSARGEPAERLDAWLDFARLHHDCLIDDETSTHHWEIRRSPGWQVPIPVGYGALGDQHAPGAVANARDPNVPFQFVESLYSIGQWVSPHRLNRPESLLWFVDNDLEHGIYRLNNLFASTYRDNR